MNYSVTVKSEEGTLITFGGYAGNQKDALANIAKFHADSSTYTIVSISFEN
jgi:hypothetical protein